MKATFATILLLVAPAAFAQTFPAAPPVGSLSAQQGRVDVFDWRETPRGQMIPIVRAVFDSNGYLLTDENGQLISVPFAGNLYAMQFGKTSGSMYFVNEGGSVPTLYVPDNGYLDNAVVADARWYPFPQRYFYTRPVFLGPAPSWNAYCDMGWYPGMSVFGGYWGVNPWRAGIVYSPMSCWTISWGNRLWNTWDDFCLFGQNYTVVRPIVIRDTRPIFFDQRDRWDRSRGNDKDWDRNRPTFRESSRPGFQAPARHSEERAQGNGGGGSDRFNYGSSAGTLGRSTPSLGSSREREYSRPSTTLSAPNMAPARPQGSFTPPGSLGNGARASSRERGYAVPNMTPVRPPSGSLGSGSSGNGYPFPSRESRESRSGSFGSRPSSSSSPSSGPSFGRSSGSDSRPTGRTSSPPSSSGSSRESRSRERSKG